MTNRAICRAAAILLGWWVLPGVLAQAAEPAARKLLIATGWDSPDPAAFRRDLAEFEKYPFDGTAIRLMRTPIGGSTTPAYLAFSKEHWVADEFAAAIADLQAATPHTATNNFLVLTANPGDVDWFDDAGWKEIVEHWRLLAWVAREGHLKGFIYDPEPYTSPFKQFKYGAQPEYKMHTFAEYVAEARARGREVMRVVVGEYPDITILSYRLFSDLLPVIRAQDEISHVLAKDNYGLAPAFVNGWLDVMPPTVKVVDGNESSYAYNSAPQFEKAYAEIKHQAPMLIDPNVRAKFLRSWQVGQAVYLDAYCNPPASVWYIDPLGSTETARLEANTASALRASDQYVWIYGEKGRWWPSPRLSPAWPERLTDAANALARAKAEANSIPP